jgi:hypothetical protein
MLLNRWPYAKRPSGLARLRYREPSAEAVSLISHLMDRNCTVDFSGGRHIILNNPIAQAIIHNNGQHTFLVHSTTQEHAKKVMKEGLVVHGAFMRPERPDLQSSVMMLAGPQERDRKDLNMFGLVYQYTGSEHNRLHENDAKIVIELPMPYPGTIYDRDPFEHTPLSKADGTMLVQESIEDNGRYRIPAKYVRGYFLQGSGEFKPNSLYRV